MNSISCQVHVSCSSMINEHGSFRQAFAVFDHRMESLIVAIVHLSCPMPLTRVDGCSCSSFCFSSVYFSSMQWKTTSESSWFVRHWFSSRTRQNGPTRVSGSIVRSICTRTWCARESKAATTSTIETSQSMDHVNCFRCWRKTYDVICDSHWSVQLR
jgi:hypothetical protein